MPVDWPRFGMARSVHRLVCILFIHLGASIRTLCEPWLRARCMRGSDTDERALLSVNRPTMTYAASTQSPEHKIVDEQVARLLTKGCRGRN
jgi:hypothetical protein